MRTRILAAAVCSFLFAQGAFAWDASGHRMITRLAIDGLPADGPVWLKEGNMPDRVADQSTVPDRWRSIKISQLQHAANPDHYFDIEDLEPYGIEFAKIPTLRMEFIKQLMEVRAAKGWKESPKATPGMRDPDKTAEWPGFLPYAILEQYGKLTSAFRVIRVVEAGNDSSRAVELEQAKADATVQMGILAHFVGDAAQPLHTTKHHHGWVGENPKGYSTERTIHAYIDGGVLKHHHLDADAVRPACKFEVSIDSSDPWPMVLEYINRSFTKVEPLYELKKSGELEKESGKEFITSRLADASTMLSALVNSAWKAAAPGKAEIEDFKRYDGGGK
jgi:hypothetical protein